MADPRELTSASLDIAIADENPAMTREDFDRLTQAPVVVSHPIRIAQAVELSFSDANFSEILQREVEASLEAARLSHEQDLYADAVGIRRPKPPCPHYWFEHAGLRICNECGATRRARASWTLLAYLMFGEAIVVAGAVAWLMGAR